MHLNTKSGQAVGISVRHVLDNMLVPSESVMNNQNKHN